jgi:hypothetical protein
MSNSFSFIKTLSLLLLMIISASALASDYIEGKVYFGVRDLIKGGHVDFVDFKEEGTGKVYSLEFKGNKVPNEIKKLIPGQQVRIKARELGGGSGQLSYEEMDDSYMPPLEDVYTVAPVNGPGERTALVVRVNFKDESQLSCNTEADLEKRIFSLSNPSSGASIFKAMSADQFKFSGKVVTINLDKYTSDYKLCTNMDLHEIADLAEDELLRQGINPKSYNYQQYYIPNSIGCNFGGWAWASANLGFVRTCSDKTPVHEFGHNFGLQHAGDSSYEYGDYSDFMGIQYRELNAPHRDQLGWMNANELKTINSSTKQTFRLYALNTNDDKNALKALKFSRSSTGDHMFLSYRTKTGAWDAQLENTYADKLNIHKAQNKGLFQNYHNKTLFVNAISPGASYTDSVTGISVKVLSKTSAYMDISINDGTSTPQNCEEVAPSINISTSYLNIEKGKTGQRSFTVKNNNDSYCDSKTYSLSIGSLTGISGSLSNASVTLASGASATVTASAVVSSSKAAGNYQLPISAKSSTNSAMVANANFLIKVIEPADTTKPSVSITSPTNGSEHKEGASVVVTASASDNVGVASVKFYLDGVYLGVDTTSPYSYQFTMPKSSGLNIKAVAMDQAGNLGESNIVQVKNPLVIDQKPVVTMLTPSGTIVKINEKVTLSAKITDDIGVKDVFFYTQYGWRLCEVGSNCQKVGDVYSMETSYSAAGDFRARAYARDTSSQSVASSSITITVKESGDTIAPTVSFQGLSSGSSFNEGSTLAVSMSAQDNVAVTKVELYLNGVRKCEDLNSPYSCSVTVPLGDFTLTAKAYDAAGNIGEKNIQLIGKAVINQPPEVSITSPSLSVVALKTGETLKVTAKITDDDGVKLVYFYNQYGWKQCEVGINCVKSGDFYTMDLNFSAAGSFPIKALAYDNTYKYNMSQTVIVNVSDATEPTDPISIVSPGQDQRFQIGEKVTVKVKLSSAISANKVSVWNSKGYWNTATLGADGLWSYSFIMESSITKVRAIVYKSDGTRELSDFVGIGLK